MENDTENGGEELSLDEAASAYAKSQASQATSNGQAEDDDTQQGTEADDALVEAGEGEPDEDGQAEDGTDEEPESDQGRFVASNGKVRLPDGSVSTVADLIQGNLRDRDYRQKTMEASEVRKTSEAQSTALRQREQQLNQQSEYVAGLIRSIIPQPPDPNLARTDPGGYVEAKANHEAWMAHLNALDGQRNQFTQAQQAEQQQNLQTRAQSEWNVLLEKVPALKDDAKAKAFGADLVKFGSDYGFSPQELQGLAFDHRQAIVMRKAIAWDKLQASKGNVQKKVEGRPPVQRGGQRLSPAQSRGRANTELVARAQKSGSVDDVAAAYAATRKR